MTAIVGFLIWLAVVAIVIYIVIWAITSIVSPPPKVTQLMYVIGVLILLYYCLVFLPWCVVAGIPNESMTFSQFCWTVVAVVVGSWLASVLVWVGIVFLRW